MNKTQPNPADSIVVEGEVVSNTPATKRFRIPNINRKALIAGGTALAAAGIAALAVKMHGTRTPSENEEFEDDTVTDAELLDKLNAES